MRELLQRTTNVTDLSQIGLHIHAFKSSEWMRPTFIMPLKRQLKEQEMMVVLPYWISGHIDIKAFMSDPQKY